MVGSGVSAHVLTALHHAEMSVSILIMYRNVAQKTVKNGEQSHFCVVDVCDSRARRRLRRRRLLHRLLHRRTTSSSCLSTGLRRRRPRRSSSRTSTPRSGEHRLRHLRALQPNRSRLLPLTGCSPVRCGSAFASVSGGHPISWCPGRRDTLPLAG